MIGDGYGCRLRLLITDLLLTAYFLFEHEDDDDYEFLGGRYRRPKNSTAPTPLLEVGAAQLHRQKPPGALTRSRSAKA